MGAIEVKVLSRTNLSRPLHIGGGETVKSCSLSWNAASGAWEEVWTGDYIFENERQSFGTKKDRTLELASAWQECPPGRRMLAVKVVDTFGNDTMTIVEVTI